MFLAGTNDDVVFPNLPLVIQRNNLGGNQIMSRYIIPNSDICRNIALD